MTAEEFYTNMFGVEPLGLTEEVMIRFAELKCQELLEIVAEKALVYNKKDGASEKYLSIEGDWITVDKNSILNAVNLKELIK